MRIRTHAFRSAMFAVASGVAGCSGGGGDPAGRTASLSVSLMDAPVDGVTEVHVKITGIEAKAHNGAPFTLTLASAPLTVDLLALTDEDSAAILLDEAAVPPGTYEWLAMDVAAEFDGIFDSYVLTATGGQEELRVPSGRVRLVSGFEVGAHQALRLLFDWDLRQALVDPLGQPGYLLKPAFRMLDVSEYGVLRGTVAANTIVDTADPNECLLDAEDPSVGNVVYVFAGLDAALDDIDGAAPEPVATAAVALDAEGYTYRVLLEPGDYTVAFTCQGANDDPEADETGGDNEIEFLPPASVTIGGDADVVRDF